MNEIAIPILLPPITAVFLVALFRFPAIKKTISLLGMITYFASTLWMLHIYLDQGVISTQMGNWPAPFGITLLLDGTAAAMLVAGGIIGVLVHILSLAEIDRKLNHVGYFPLLHMLLFGFSGAVLTGDLFNLYVWFEVLLVSSFGLLMAGGKREQLIGGVQYITVNLLSTALLLGSIGMIYGKTGTLNIGHLASIYRETPNDGVLNILLIVLLFSLSIKSALFPLFFWLPASYHTPPVPVSALFSALLTKIGIYSMFRLTLAFAPNEPVIKTLFLISACFTMFVGVLGAISQNEMRKILSVHIISQIGYIILGLAISSKMAIAAALYYMFHNIVVKTNLFFIAGVTRFHHKTLELAKVGGEYKRSFFLSVLFLISAFSLAGFPPFSGFFAKFSIIRASFSTSHYVAAFVALLTGVFTALSMTKIFNEIYLKPCPQPETYTPRQMGAAKKICYFFPILVLTCLTLVLGIFPAPFSEYFDRCYQELVNPVILPYLNSGGSL
jgi:multicomponent Na+:H+ antiporter subunit D